MQTDTYLRTHRPMEHRPDVVLGDVCYEVERNHKDNSKLLKNLQANDFSFSSQVWVVPDSKASIGRRIKALAEKNGREVTALPLDKIYQMVDEADVHNNAGKWSSPKGMPVEEPKSVESVLSKYGIGGEQRCG